MDYREKRKFDRLPSQYLRREHVVLYGVPIEWARVMQDCAELMGMTNGLENNKEFSGYWNVILINDKQNGAGRLVDSYKRNSNFPYSMNYIEILIHNFVTVMAVPGVTEYIDKNPELYRRILRSVKNSNYNMTSNVLQNEKRDFIRVRILHPMEKITMGLTLDEPQWQWISEQQVDSAWVVLQFLTESFVKDHINIALTDFVDQYYDTLSRIKLLEPTMVQDNYIINR